MKKQWLVLVMMAWAGLLHAQVYKWVDAEGKIQYGDAPPKGVNASKVSGGVTVMPAFPPPPAPVSAPVAKPVAEEREAVRGGISARTEPAKPVSNESPALSPREEARRKMMEECLRNRGANCDAEVDAQLNGQGGTVFVPVPGWSRPPIRPTPKPQPLPEQSRPSGGMEKIQGNPTRKGDRL